MTTPEESKPENSGLTQPASSEEEDAGSTGSHAATPAVREDAEEGGATATPTDSSEELESPEDPLTKGPSRRIVFCCLAVFAALCFWSSARRDLWRDEGSHALSVSEMSLTEMSLASGSYLVATRLTEPRLDTPPLYHWFAAISARAVGVFFEEGSFVPYRIPTILFAVLGLWLTYRLGSEVFDGRVAFLAMTLQATTALFFMQSSWVSPHMTFVALCQLSLTGFMLGARSETLRWKILAHLGLGAAALAGNPLAALSLVMLPILLVDFISGGLDAVRTRQRNVGGSFRWVFSIGLAAPWYVYAAYAHGEVLLTELIASDSTSFDQGSFFDGHLLPLIVGFLPWTLLAPLGLFHAKDRLSRRGEGLCMSWFFVALFVLALSPWRHPGYLIFLWPPLCLLIPASLYETRQRFSVWEDILRRQMPRLLPLFLRIPLVAAILIGILGFAGWLTPILGERAQGLFEDSKSAGIALALAIVAGGGSFYAARRVAAHIKAQEIPTAIFETTRAILFVLLVSGLLLPLFNSIESSRYFAERLQGEVGEAQVATYGSERPWELSYFTGRRIPHFDEVSSDHESHEALLEFLDVSDTRYLLVPMISEDGLRLNSSAIFDQELRPTGFRGFMGARGEMRLYENQH